MVVTANASAADLHHLDRVLWQLGAHLAQGSQNLLPSNSPSGHLSQDGVGDWDEVGWHFQ